MTKPDSRSSAHVRRLITMAQARLRDSYRAKVAVPRSTLGVRLDAVNTTLSDLVAAVSAVSGYTTVVQNIAPPPIQMQTTPDGPGVPSDVYDQYVDRFLPEWAQFESVTSQWMMPNQLNTGYSSQLAMVPENLTIMNGQVSADLEVLLSEPAGSATYNTARDNLTGLLQSQIAMLQGLSDQLSTYSGNLEMATNTVLAEADTGALAQALAAYQTEIDAINAQLDDLERQLTDDYIELGIAYGDAALTGVVMMIGRIGVRIPIFPVKVLASPFAIFGAAFFAATLYAVNSVKADIAATQAEIDAATSALATDSDSLTSLGIVIGQIDDLGGLETEVIAALGALIAALGTLEAELDQLVSEAGEGDPAAVQGEWQALMDATAELATMASYQWPDGSVIGECKTLAPTSTGVATLGVDGAIHLWAEGQGDWRTLSGTAVSVAASDTELVIIRGKPVCATDPVDPEDFNYFAARWHEQDWVDISSGPVSNIAVCGSAIYAISAIPAQGGGGFEVLQYSGSGVEWTSLGIPDAQDPAVYLAACDGAVVVTTRTYGRCYLWDGAQWSRIEGAAAALLSPSAAGALASVVDVDHRAYVLDTNAATLRQTAAPAYITALAGDGTQYLIDGNGALTMLDTTTPGATPQDVAGQMAAVYSDVGGLAIYAANAMGQISRIVNANGQATLSPLPAVPTPRG